MGGYQMSHLPPCQQPRSSVLWAWVVMQELILLASTMAEPIAGCKESLPTTRVAEAIEINADAIANNWWRVESWHNWISNKA